MAMTPIRVLLVDDSPLTLTVLKRALATAPEIQVVGTAADGREALARMEELKPTVVCTDFQMPVMDGLELTREIMARCPCPILVVSAVVGEAHPERVFALLEAGAIDVFPKPSGGLPAGSPAAEELIRKIKIASRVFVFPRRGGSKGDGTIGRGGAGKGVGTGLPTPTQERNGSFPITPAPAARPRLLAIGASTGGPKALQSILSRLPADFPAPVLCVQHISLGFLEGLVEWLSSQCRIRVEIARSGVSPRAGHVYFPQEDTHLTLDDGGCLRATNAPPVEGHRPSVSTTFLSVARCCGAAAVAVLLTGMGRDGVEGMQAIARAGGVTIAQDEASSVVFGMPKEAIAAGAARHVLPPEEIARMLLGKVTWAGR
jgi:two-component system, chemotaxis family, protein-glutamate methylesterase/glutaminase